MRAVGVLILVDVQVAEAALILVANIFVVAKQAIRQRDDLAEVDRIVREQVLLILGVDALQLLIKKIMRRGLQVFRTDGVALGAVDRPLQGLRAECFLVDSESLHGALNERELIGVVVDHELLLERCTPRFTAQNPNADGVERADLGLTEHRALTQKF